MIYFKRLISLDGTLQQGVYSLAVDSASAHGFLLFPITSDRTRSAFSVEALIVKFIFNIRTYAYNQNKAS